jgi:predicted permease
MTLPSGIKRLFRIATRSGLKHELDDELAFHFEMWKKEFLETGMSHGDAEAAARNRFGDLEAFRRYGYDRAERKARWESARDWLVEWMQDVRFAARHLRRAPAFTAVAVLTLALGIGANTAIFSVVRHLLVSPLPYPNGDRVVALKVFAKPTVFGGLASIDVNAPREAPLPLRDAWLKRARSFEQVGGVAQDYFFLLPDGRQDTVSYASITSNFLDLLGVRPSLGRGFRPDEEREGAAHNVAMLSHSWWMAAYGGSEDAIGKTLLHDNQAYTIVGVMPERFTIPMTRRQLDQLSNPAPDVWFPTTIENAYNVVGLLRRGVSAEAATAELQNITDGSDWRGAGGSVRHDSLRAQAMRAQDFLAPRDVRTIEVLFAAVGALLLIACVNVANLLLVRAWTRRREFAVRMGLGAGRARLIRLALTESTLLALVAGALGTVIAWQALHWIVALRPLSLDALTGAHLDPTVLTWTAIISIVTGILFGGAAAFFVSSRNVGDLLRSETRSSSDGISIRMRSTLIVAEIALSVALLVCAGLLVRSFATLQETPLGFDPHNLVSFDIILPHDINGSPSAAAVKAAIAERLAAVPGATAAAIGFLPTAGFAVRPGLDIEADEGAGSAGIDRYLKTLIDPNYFRTAGIRVIAGRLPEPRPDDVPPDVSRSPAAGAPPVRIVRELSDEIVVNETLARRIAPEGSALGHRVRAQPGGGGRGTKTSDAWSTIVGVVEDVRLPGAPDDNRANQVYTLAFNRLSPTYVVRFASLPPHLESTLRRAVQTVNPRIAGRRVRIADDYLNEALAPTRFMLALLGAFAVVAILLAAVGLYGSIAYSVSLRTREIGIRVALGATPRGVVALIVGDGVRLIIVGVSVGLMIAVSTTRSVSSLLYGVGTGDPTTYASTALLVIAIATAASYVPARRAARIDAVDALRAE